MDEVKDKSEAQPPGDQEVDDLGEETLLDYLQSDKGHEILSQVLAMAKDAISSGLHKATVERDYAKQRARDLYIFQGLVFVATVIPASLLTYYDKFSTPIGILFGTLLGYVFGRRGNGQQ